MCFQTNRDSQLWLGLVAFVIGGVMLLTRFDLVPAETWDYLWPSILVVTGLKWMIMRGGSDSCKCSEEMDMCECGSGDCDGSCALPMPAPKKTTKKKSRK